MLTDFIYTYQIEENINRFLVFEAVKNTPLSIAGITRVTGLSTPTVQKIVAKLVDQKLIYNQGMGASSGGRKPVLYTFNREGIYAIGIDFEAPQCSLAVVNGCGEILKLKQMEFTYSQKADEVLAELAKMSKEIVESLGIHPSLVLGIGIGLPGILKRNEKEQSTIERMESWINIPVQERLEQLLPWAIFTENDSNAQALAEKWFGCAKDITNFVYISIRHHGIGLGIINNDQVALGIKGQISLFGHMIIAVDGPVCTCGAQGCLEAFLSPNYLAQFNANHEKKYLIDILKQANFDDNKPLFSHIGKTFGLGLTNVIKLFAPSCIVIGGDIGGNADTLIALTRPYISEFLAKFAQPNLILKPCEIHENTGVKGAGAVVFQNLLCQPSLKFGPNSNA